MAEQALQDRLKLFEELCAKHDLTYSYSDDGRAYRAGCKQRDEISALAKELPYADVKRIWDAAVDKKIIAGQRDQWYWR